MGDAMTTSAVVSKKSQILASVRNVVSSGEEIISHAFADTFFSDDLKVGRLLALVLIASSLKIAVAGSLGALIVHFCSLLFTQNITLRKSRIFALNGLFLGMALSYFVHDVRMSLGLILGLSPLCAVVVIALNRLLKTWGLPILVLPYCIVFWMAQYLSKSSGKFYLLAPISNVAELSQIVPKFMSGGVLGFGQIFFSDQWFISLLVLLTVAISNRSKFYFIILAAVLPAVVSTVVLGDHWTVKAGISSFGGILLMCGFLKGHISVKLPLIWTLVAVSGLMEVSIMKVLEINGLYVVSGAYVVTYWVAKLCEETQAISNGSNKNNAIMAW
jgi:urea transporter